MQRQFDPAVLEMMDRPQPVTTELVNDLRNIRRFNRYLGSHALIRFFLRRWLKPGCHFRVLDLATGSGDIPRLIVDYARKVEARVGIDAVDQQGSTLQIARGLSSHYPEITFHEGNILEWPPNEPYDLVLSTLVLHHFSEEDAVRLLRHARKLSRRFVLVSDLRRGFLARAGVYLLTATFFREPMTVYDARVSAARAFSFHEMSDLVRRAGWQNFGHKRFRFARQAVWLE